MSDNLIIEGDCLLYENEGGFSAPEVSIDGVPLDRALLLWRFGELPTGDRGGNVDADRFDLGRVRITVEPVTDG